jgi:endo-beta-N-acetylglucosaminidase D
MHAWTQYVAQLDPTYNKTNLIYNGSFETAPVDCPFDWHIASSNSIRVERDSESMYKGGSSLRLQFVARPKTSEPQAYQTVLVKPGNLEIKAAMKTSGVAADQGVIIRVLDAEDPARLDTATDAISGTQAWLTISKVFQVGAKTRMVRVEITHVATAYTSSSPTATAWVDDITLTPVP